MKKILIVLTLTFSISLSAQDVNLSSSQLNINVLSPSLSFEGKIGEKQSLTIATGLGFAGEYTYDSNAGSGSSFYAIPIVYGSFRNYYTRKNVNKSNLRNNSGNYVGLYLHYQLEALGQEVTIVDNIYAIGPVWGIQRNYASGIHLGLSLGIGVIGGEFIETGVSGIGEFEFGFVLFQN